MGAPEVARRPCGRLEGHAARPSRRAVDARLPLPPAADRAVGRGASSFSCHAGAPQRRARREEKTRRRRRRGASPPPARGGNRTLRGAHRVGTRGRRRTDSIERPFAIARGLHALRTVGYRRDEGNPASGVIRLRQTACGAMTSVVAVGPGAENATTTLTAKRAVETRISPTRGGQPR